MAARKIFNDEQLEAIQVNSPCECTLCGKKYANLFFLWSALYTCIILIFIYVTCVRSTLRKSDMFALVTFHIHHNSSFLIEWNGKLIHIFPSGNAKEWHGHEQQKLDKSYRCSKGVGQTCRVAITAFQKVLNWGSWRLLADSASTPAIFEHFSSLLATAR